jgi:hypothetical protein
VVGNAVIDLPRAFLLVAEEVRRGTFTPRVETFGLSSGVVRYEPNPALDSMVPARLAAKVRAASDSIAAGTLVAVRRRGPEVKNTASASSVPSVPPW